MAWSRLAVMLLWPLHLASGSVLVPTLTLNDGKHVPGLGLGVYMSQPGDETYNAVKWALELGYRMVDTAQMYRNEESVGKAIADSGIPRKDLWIQSKLETSNHGYEKTIAGVEDSLKKMGLDYLDCYLVHSPFGGKLVETWDALLHLQKQGKLRSLGVSNYDVRHIEALSSHGRPLPTLNQIEMHPLIQGDRQNLLDYCQKNGIIVQAYGSLFFGQENHLNDAKVSEVVKKHPGKTAAHVLLRWGWQKGFQLIPKSVKKHRLQSNIDIFDFTLTDEDMKSLDSMKGELGAYWNPVKDAEVDLGDINKGRAEL